MKRLLVCLVIIFASNTACAQNILSNGSFEQYTTCPNSWGPMPNGWFRYTNSDPDYFNSCVTSPINYDVPLNSLGTQGAADGNAYMGMLSYLTPDIREYFATSFTPTRIGDTYEISLSVSLADNSKYATDGLGVYFYDVASAFVNNQKVLAVTPQVLYAGVVTDKINWTRLSETFVADSMYDNLVIGCYKDDITINKIATSGLSSYTYYYIDSVVLKRLSNININHGSASLCPGETITVPYSLIGPSMFFATGNVFTLQLSGPTGSFASPVNIGSVTATIAGSIQGTIPAGTAPGTGYRVRVISSNTADTSAVNSQDISIKPVPYPTAGSNSPVCENSALNLTATALSGSSYSWAGPVTVPSVQNPSFSSATLAHTGDYIVTATLNGCTAKDTISVLIKPQPAAPTAGSNTPVCETETLNLTSTSITPGVSYSWTGPVTVPGTQNPSLTNVTAGHDGIYNVAAVLNGCASAAASTTVVIKPMPAVPTAGSNSPVCTGGILNLTANSSTAGVTYTWTGPGGFTSTSQNPTIDPAAITDAGTYDVTATLNGCTSAAGSTNVVINTVAYLGAYASPNDTICEGATLTVVTVPTNSGTSPQFQWFKNGVAVAGQTQLTYAIANAATGDTFYCRMIAGNNCNTPITLFSNKIGITVLPTDPSPVVNITSIPAQPLPGNPVTFTANITSGTGISYQWQRNGQDVVGATSNTWATSNLNPYDKISVKATTDKPCPDSSTAVSNVIEVNFPTGINDINKTNKLQLFPNPNKGSFTIKQPLPASPKGRSQEKILVEVMNAVGQTIYSQQHKPVNGTIDISLGAVVAGVYLVKLGEETLRFVVE